MAHNMTGNEHDETWVAALSLLETFHDMKDDLLRLALLEKCLAENGLVYTRLTQLGFAGGSPPIIEGFDKERCGYCSTPFEDAQFIADGKTREGSWAYMCMPCFAEHGLGLGLGVGQLFRRYDDDYDRSRGRWQCIAGCAPRCGPGKRDGEC